MKRFSCIKQVATGIVISLAVTACASQGQMALALPKSDTALVITTSDTRLWIGAGIPGKPMTQRLRVLPGYGCVNVAATIRSVGKGLDRPLRKLELCFEADAGKTYEVAVFHGPAQPPRLRWRIVGAQVLDVETGQILDSQEVS